MDPHELLDEVARRLRTLAADAVDGLLRQLPELGDDPSAGGTVLAGRLLAVHDRLPAGNSLVELVREVLGDLTEGSAVRLHGWRRTPGSLGVAFVLSDPVAGLAAGRAVLALTPAGNGPVVDIVVTPGSTLTLPSQAHGPWTATGSAASPSGWEASVGPGIPPVLPTGTVQLTAQRTGRLQAGMAGGPGMSVEGVALTVSASPQRPPSFALELTGLRASVLPAALARLVGLPPGGAMAADRPERTGVRLDADRAGGLRFAGSEALHVDLPLRIDGPGISSRGAAVTVGVDGGEPRLGFSLSLSAGLPGLPLRTAIDGAGIDLPVLLGPGTRLGLDPSRLRELMPDGIGADLVLPPVAGGGLVKRLPDGGYGGLVQVSLGVLRLQAFAVFRPPSGGQPTTFLLLLGATFPPPGIQVGLGFALDGVGGLVGVNRRVDVSALTQLVREGHADRLLFPDDALGKADAVIAALTSAFPVRAGRMLVGPMLRLSWGGRIVTLAGSLVLELPAPVTAVLLGRLLVAMPDPAVPLIRLQASVLGQVDPTVPRVELLVSLAGSWIVGLAVRGELYLLVRGGAQPEFVLSAGGFHPRYQRPRRRTSPAAAADGPGAGRRLRTADGGLLRGHVERGDVRWRGPPGGHDRRLRGGGLARPGHPVRLRPGVRVLGARARGGRRASVRRAAGRHRTGLHPGGPGSLARLRHGQHLGAVLGRLPRLRRPVGIATGDRAQCGDATREPALRLAVAQVEAWTAERPAAERTALLFTAPRPATAGGRHPGPSRRDAAAEPEGAAARGEDLPLRAAPRRAAAVGRRGGDRGGGDLGGRVVLAAGAVRAR